MRLHQLRILKIDAILLRTAEILQLRGHAVGVNHRHVDYRGGQGAVDTEAALMLACNANRIMPTVITDASQWVPPGMMGRYMLTVEFLETHVGDLAAWSDSTETNEIVSTLTSLAGRIRRAVGVDHAVPRYVGRPVATLQPSGLDIDAVEQMIAAVEGGANQ